MYILGPGWQLGHSQPHWNPFSLVPAGVPHGLCDLLLGEVTKRDVTAQVLSSPTDSTSPLLTHLSVIAPLYF
jgi:hypothetical protein